jgi:DNA ligase D-like protein (predicted 3'-phosphoesterase)
VTKKRPETLRLGTLFVREESMVKDDKLDHCKRKRDFSKTPKPKAGSGKSFKKPIFVIQQHDAGRMHYDFRLEVDGVMVSWAVPKGLSTDARDKRLAVRTEDHPLDYADFEGRIPEGEYGAGVVIVWDAGKYENMSQEEGKEISLKKD